ncbi:MAG: class I SAM-dependent methyltransferase [Nitrospirota bacterium]
MNKYCSCNLCGGEDIKFLWEKGGSPRYGYKILQCQNCELVFIDTILDDEEFYSKDFFVGGDQLTASYTDYVQDREILKPELKRRLTRIKEFVRGGSGGRLLDVGCALGFFLDEARNDFDTYGVEISKFAAEYSSEKLGLQVTTGRFLDIEFESESFDCITFWDVIEHLPDPTLNLKKAYNLLKPNGLLVLSTGDIGSFVAKLMGKHWHLLLPPQHIYYFSQETIKKILEKTGFEVVKIKYWGKSMTLTHFFRRLSFLLKNRLLYQLIELTPMSKMRLELNLFDIMTVFARKL